MRSPFIAPIRVRGPIELLADTMRREADGVMRLLGSVRDITLQRQAEQDRVAMEDRMRDAQRLESLGVLAGGIAHDFNNLLSVVLGNSALALEELDEEELGPGLGNQPARRMIIDLIVDYLDAIQVDRRD